MQTRPLHTLHQHGPRTSRYPGTSSASRAFIKFSQSACVDNQQSAIGMNIAMHASPTHRSYLTTMRGALLVAGQFVINVMGQFDGLAEPMSRGCAEAKMQRGRREDLLVERCRR